MNSVLQNPLRLLVSNMFEALIIILFLSIAFVYCFNLIRIQQLQNQLTAQAKLTADYQQELADMQAQLKFLKASALGVGDRVLEVVKTMHSDREHLKLVEISESVPAKPVPTIDEDKLYRQQADRVLKGRQLPNAEASNISRSEAELVALLAGRQRQKAD